MTDFDALIRGARTTGTPGRPLGSADGGSVPPEADASAGGGFDGGARGGGFEEPPSMDALIRSTRNERAGRVARGAEWLDFNRNRETP